MNIVHCWRNLHSNILEKPLLFKDTMTKVPIP